MQFFFLALLLLVISGFSIGSSAIEFVPTRAQETQTRVKAAREAHNEKIQKIFLEHQIDYPPAQVLLRIFKQDAELELWVQPKGKNRFEHIKNYAICAGSGELGPKRRQGDLQVPEGFYQVIAFNPNSSFHLAMLVNYPNASDRIRGHPRNPGGSICIHGNCVTIGCVPLTDPWIEELYLICLDTQWRSGKNPLVHILPTRLTDAQMEKLQQTFKENPKLISFWKELQPGFLYFEETHLPAPFTVQKDGAYRFVAPNRKAK